MSKSPLLSVFMPAFNAQAFVREAVESALDNGFAEIEVVVIDDGSTDATADIVESIHHPALRLARNPRNLGGAETRQRGISLLHGRYVALLDADDIAVPGRFERQVNRLEAADGPDIVGGGIEYFGDEQGTAFYPSTDAKIKAGLLFFGCPLANPTICMKLAPLREARIAYSPEAGPAEDYALWLDAMRAGLRFENLPVVLTRYRRHRDAITKKTFDQCAAAARRVRQRVVETFFPQMNADERESLVNALSYALNGGPRWVSGVFALSRAAMLAAQVPGVDSAWMIKSFESILLGMVERALKLGAVDNETLEMMTETNEHFEYWRMNNSGALDAKIMALIA